jgi:hypothetical protein
LAKRKATIGADDALRRKLEGTRGYLRYLRIKVSRRVRDTRARKRALKNLIVIGSRETSLDTLSCNELAEGLQKRFIRG